MFFAPILIRFLPYIIAATVILGGYAYIQYQDVKLEVARSNILRLEDITKSQDVALKQKDADIERIRALSVEISKKWSVANQETINLKKKLTETKIGESRDLGKLISKDPKIMEDRINRGTRFALRCNEILSGSPILEMDKDNNICPSLIIKRANK